MRFLNLFVFFIYLFVSSFDTSNSTNEQSQANEAFVVFIQSDLDPQSYNDKSNFNMIWGKIMPELLLKIVEREGATCFFYPLNEDTKGANSLFKPDLRELFKQTDYRRKRTLNESIEIYKRSHANRMMNQSNYQDILSSFLVMKSLKDNLANVRTIRIIFISDMVHYITTGETTDAEKGIYNFAYEYSLNMFRQNIEKGILYDEIRLQPIIGDNVKQVLLVYSIFLPRGDDREEISSSIRNELDTVWRAFFGKIGAKKVRLNLSVDSIDQIFSDF